MKNTFMRLVSILLALVLAFNFAPIQMVQAEEQGEILLEQTEMFSEGETENTGETEIVVPEEEQPGASEDEENKEEITAGENSSKEGTELTESQNTESTGEELTGEELIGQEPTEEETGEEEELTEDELVVEEPEEEDLLEADEDYGDVEETVRKFMGFKSAKDIPNGIWVYDPQKDSRSYTSKAVVLSDDVRVFNNKDLLTKGTDYTITYKNNVNAGDATAVITGKGLYKGTVSYTYKIKPLNLNDKNSSIWYKGQKTNLITLRYNGNVQKPRATIKYNLTDNTAITLKENVDYKLNFDNTDSKSSLYDKDAFKKEGTYVVSVCSLNKNFTGDMSYTVEINKKIPMTKCKSYMPSVVDITKLEKGLIPESTFEKWAKVTYGNRTLKEGIDFTLETKSTDKPNVGYFIFIATPDSDFTGTLVKKVTIKCRSISNVYVVMPKPDDILAYEMENGGMGSTSWYENNVQVYPSAAASKDSSKRLEVGEEYIISKVSRDWNTGKVSVTLTGTCNGNYICQGDKVVSTSLNLPSIANAKVTTPGLVYVGGYPNISTVLKVTYKGEELKGLETKNVTQVKKDYDYYYSIEDLSNSKYKVRITGRPGRFKGKKELTITLPKMNLSSKDTEIKAANDTTPFNSQVRVRLASCDYKYNPTGCKQGIAEVSYLNRESNTGVYLNRTKDYKITWQNVNKAGTGQVTITGIGIFTGKVVYKYKIEPYDISKNGVDKGISNIVAKSTAGLNAPTINLYHNGRKLVAGTDYSKVIYKYADGTPIGAKDIVKPGTKIAVTINGKGNYTGSFTQVVTVESNNIAKAKQAPISKTVVLDSNKKAGVTKLTNADIKLTYNGEAVPSDAFVIKASTYKNNNKLGDATVVIEGNGKKGFAGTLTIKYKIVAKNITK